MSFFGRDAPAAPPPADQFHVSDFARQRIGQLRGDDGRGRLFTSDLSVAEYVMVKKAGFEPLGLVVGSSIYHIGYQRTQWTVSQEMTVLSQAMYSARELAMTRMEEEAEALGADGVVGVRLEMGHYEWAEGLAEFRAIGTAVRSADGTSHRTNKNKPFTSDLSGQDFAMLLSVGYMPAGLVLGSCVYHVAHQSFAQAWKTMNANVEMANFTQAMYDAREIAMARMQAEAKDLGAEGIVGVSVSEKSHRWELHMIEYLAVGTAIVPRAGGATGALPIVLDVSGR